MATEKKLYKVDSDEKPKPAKWLLNICGNQRYLTVDMNVKAKTLTAAYQKMARAIAQAVEDGALPKTYHEFFQVDFDSEENLFELLTANNSDISFDCDDNTDIDGSFYIKMAVDKVFFSEPAIDSAAEVEAEAPSAESTAIVVPTGASSEVATAEKSFWAVVEDWLSELSGAKNTGKKKKSPRTIETYRYAMKNFKSWLDAESITVPTIQTLNDWRAEIDGRAWSPATKNLHITGVRNFFKWLSAKHAMANVAAGLEGWACTKEHKRGFLSLSEMKDLINIVEPVIQSKINSAQRKSQRERLALQCLRDKAILTVLMCGGLRTVEINRLRVCDLVKDGGATMLNVLGKGRADYETVKISNKAARVIREWMTAREAVDIVSDTSPLFCSLGNNSFGDQISSLSVSRLVKEYLRAAGLKEKEYQLGDKKSVVKPIVAHSLRGSCATCAFQNGASLEQVKQQLRHRNLATTEIYLEESAKFKNVVSDIISDGIL